MPRFSFPDRAGIAGLVGADGRHKYALTEIDGLPGEAEDLTLAKTEDQDQDECGLKRIGAGARGFEKAPGLLTRPGQAQIGYASKDPAPVAAHLVPGSKSPPWVGRPLIDVSSAKHATIASRLWAFIANSSPAAYGQRTGLQRPDIESEIRTG